MSFPVAADLFRWRTKKASVSLLGWGRSPMVWYIRAMLLSSSETSEREQTWKLSEENQKSTVRAFHRSVAIMKICELFDIPHESILFHLIPTDTIIVLICLPAASMNVRLRRKVRSGSLRLRRKSLRRLAMTWISSTLLSTGTVLDRRNFSFSSRTVRSAPDTR